MKRVAALLTSCLLMLTLVSGCTKQTPAKTSSGGKVTINFLIMPDISVLQPIFNTYEKENPGVTIKVTVLPFDSMFQAIDVMLGSGDKSVDAMLVDAPVVANYAVKGYTTPLDSYINPKSKTLITKSSLQACTYDGKLMALPLNSSCVELYYNKDIFAAKGVTPPDNDVQKRWTWEQVVDAAKKLTYTQNGKKVWGLTFEQIGRPYQLLPLAQSLGATKMVSDDGLTSTGYTNSPEMIKAAQWYYDTFNTWKISPKITADDSVGYFTSGQVAMFVGGSWQIPAMQTAKLNFGYAPHPYFAGGKVVTPTGSWCVGVSNFSTKKAAAAKFVEYITTNNEACQQNFDIGNNLPCNVSVLNNINSNSKYDASPANVIKLAVYESLNTAMIRPQMAGYDEWESVMETTYSDIENGELPDKALNGAVANIDNQLQKYKK